MNLSRQEIMDSVICPKCRAQIGKRCRHRGKGAAEKTAKGINHHEREILGQREAKAARAHGLSAIVTTDASRCGETCVGGWAALIQVEGRDKPIGGGGQLPRTGHPAEAEMMAALNGIQIARTHGANGILIQTDSIMVVHLIQGVTRCATPLKVWRRLVSQTRVDLNGVRARYVQGHTLNDGDRFEANRWCDKEAKKHMREARGQ